MILHVWKNPNSRCLAECIQIQDKQPYSTIDPETGTKIYLPIPVEDIPALPYEIIGDGSVEDFEAWRVQQIATGWVAAPPEPIVPSAVTCATLRIAIKRLYGITEENVDALIAGISDVNAKWEAETLWKKSPTIRRRHPLVLSFSAAFGLTSSQVDQAFILAETL